MGLLGNTRCTDKVRVKFWKSSNPNDYKLSSKFLVGTTSHFIKKVDKYIEYDYQVIEKVIDEDKDDIDDVPGDSDRGEDNQEHGLQQVTSHSVQNKQEHAGMTEYVSYSGRPGNNSDLPGILTII